MKRFNLVILDETYTALEKVAQQHKTSKTAIIKQFIKLGFMLETPGNVHILKTENGELKKITF